MLNGFSLSHRLIMIFIDSKLKKMKRSSFYYTVRNIALSIAAMLLVLAGLLFAATCNGQTSFPSPKPAPSKSIIKITCQGLTIAGQPCKIQVPSGETHCGHHNPNAARCGQPTKAGTPCKRRVKVQGAVCSQHSPSSSIVEDQIIY